MLETSAQHSLFPVTLTGQWCAEKSAQLPPVLKSWLLDPGSLTARLTQTSQSFHVELLGQAIEACRAEEATEDIKTGEEVLVREVLLFCNDVPHVFARSLLPLKSLTGEEQQLAHLGNQSLGQILFNHPKLIRKRIEVSSFTLHSSVGNVVNHFQQSATHDLWGRRSIFMVEGKPLMVAEVFLPESLAYKAN